MPLFYGRNKREEQKDRDFRMPPKPPGGACVFSALQSYAAIRPRVWPWLLNGVFHRLSRCPRPEVGKLTCLWHNFHNFLLRSVMGNVWKRGLVQFFLKGRGACLNLPHRWLCVEQWLLRPTHTDGGRRRESGQRCPSKRLERNFWFLVKHGISCVSIQFGCTHSCVSVVTCCHAITRWCLLMGKRPLNVAKLKSKQWGGRRGRRYLTLKLIRAQIILAKNSLFFFPKPIVFIFIAVISSYQIEKHNEIGICFSMIDALLPQR